MSRNWSEQTFSSAVIVSFTWLDAVIPVLNRLGSNWTCFNNALFANLNSVLRIEIKDATSVDGEVFCRSMLSFLVLQASDLLLTFKLSL